MIKTRDAARGKWKGILTHFGIDESFLKNEHGPCPICGGKDRFRWDDRDGDGTYYCSGCDNSSDSGLSLLMAFKNWPFDKACREVDSILGNVETEDKKAKQQTEDKRSILIRLWKEAKPVSKGDPVWLYLERRCGDPSAHLQNIRFHPALRHSIDKGTHPGMLALLQPNGQKACGIHRTFLTLDGFKAQVNPVRMVYGECAQVALQHAQELLGVAEGIETAICASKAFRVPCWAALNANGMKAWEAPEGVKSVVIFGDNDRSLTGQEAAYALGHRLVRQGLTVEMQIPPTVDTDWCDVFANMPREEVPHVA